MKPHAIERIVLYAATAACFAIGCKAHRPTEPQANSVRVTATNPGSATQDTTLDVVVSGSGFDNGSVAQWAINGVPASKVQTNSTRFVNAEELITNITVTADADTGSYDVAVTTPTGRKGIGLELFTIKRKPPADPAIAFVGTSTPSPLTVMNVDGSNAAVVAPDAWPGGASWAPFGNGSAGSPYRLLFMDTICSYAVVDVDTVGGQPRASNLHTLAIGDFACPGVQPAWSPAGDLIAFTAYTGPITNAVWALYLISSNGGAATAVYTAPQGNELQGLAWRSDASAIAFREYDAAAGGNAIRVLNFSSGTITTVIGPHDFSENRAFFDWGRTHDVLTFSACRSSPCGWETDTLTLTRNASGDIIAAGSPQRLATGFHPVWSPDDAFIAMDGIKVLDLGSGTIRQLAAGESPGWRR